MQRIKLLLQHFLFSLFICRSFCSIQPPSTITETVSNIESNNNLTFLIHHLLDNSENFNYRSKIQLITKPDGKQGLLYFDKNVINQDSLNDFKSLLSNNGLYKIIIQLENSNDSKPILSSIPAVNIFITVIIIIIFSISKSISTFIIIFLFFIISSS